MAKSSSIIAAIDNDEAGDRLVDQFGELVGGLDREDLVFLEDRPAERGRDWNDSLRSSWELPQPSEDGKPEPA